MTRISKAGKLIHRTDSIRHIRDVEGKFRVAFSGHASLYRTAEPALQQIIREAHAAKREVSFSTSPDCEIHSVEMLPPHSVARRIADRVERLSDIFTRRSMRWWRDAQRRAANRPNE